MSVTEEAAARIAASLVGGSKKSRSILRAAAVLRTRRTQPTRYNATL
jgi:hypothetical protein